MNKISRREFVQGCAAAAATIGATGCSTSAPAILTGKKPLIWANLIQLGCNMWNDHDMEPGKPYSNRVADYLRFDEKVWRDLTEQTRDAGMNMVIVDLAEGLVYPSHPELAVKGS